LPAHCTVNGDGIQVSPMCVYDISYIFYILENDNKGREKEMEKVKVKFETIIQKYAVNNDKDNIKSELKKCVIGINKLDNEYHFIMTAEAEELYEKLIKISEEKGLIENDAEKIIEEHRDW
jgi:hypothetical protein